MDKVTAYQFNQHWFKKGNLFEQVTFFLWWGAADGKAWDAIYPVCATVFRETQSSTRANTSPGSGMEYHQVTKWVEEGQLCRKVSNEGQVHNWAALESEVSKIKGSDSSVCSTWDSIQSILCNFGIPNRRKILINWTIQLLQAQNIQRKVGQHGLIPG